jgi:hypothetical protein
MNAIVNVTGEHIEVLSKQVTLVSGHEAIKYIDQKTGVSYFAEELYFPKDLTNDPDYWTRLEHQAAIAAMGGMCGNTKYNDYAWVDMAKFAIKAAHALVEKLKKKEEIKCTET